MKNSEWTGRVGAEWAKRSDPLDLFLAPFGEAGIAALGLIEGRSVLDLGCGAGATSAALAEKGAKVTGVDISPDLIEIARSRFQGDNPSFHLGDAAELPVDVPFDALSSRFGAMFFADPVPAFRHIRSTLRPDAAVSLVAWVEPLENDWVMRPLALAQARLGAEMTHAPETGVPGPFAWADDAVFRAILSEAGFRDLAIERVHYKTEIGAGESEDPAERGAFFCMRIGPLASRLREMPKELRYALERDLTEGLRDDVADGAVRLGGTAWVITARA